MDAPVSATPSAARRRRLRGLAVFLVLILAALAAWFYWPRTPAVATPKRSIPVKAEAVTQGSLKVWYKALGTLTSPASVIVRPRVDGQLMRFAVREGELVKAGQLIAEIDPRPFQLTLTHAQGQLARDAAELDNARLILARYRTLQQQDSISTQQVETQSAQVRQLEGELKLDQAAVDSAKLQLGYSRVVAPVSGRLGLRVVDAGNVVRASEAAGLISINQVQPINAVFTLPEAQLAAVMKPLLARETLKVEAWDRSQSTRLASGKVVAFDNQIDSATGTVRLKAEFGNKDASLFPNQFVNVRLLAQTLDKVTLAPLAAVQRGRDGAFVYLLRDDSKVTQRRVKLGDSEGERVVVTAGLKPGDVVITDGIDQLREGTLVELADASALLKPRQRGGRKPKAAQSGAASSH